MNRLDLQKEDVAFILDKSYRYFPAMVKGVYCNHCKSSYMTALVDYTICLTHEDDILLEGFCSHCRRPLKRRIETGEKEEPQLRAYATRLVKAQLQLSLGSK